MTFKVTKYPHGTICWADCTSTNVEAAKPFYQAVMDWAVESIPLGNGEFYYMYSIDGVNVAAVSGMQPEMQAQGMPSVWNTYINVENVDVLTAKVKELGGTVIAEPFDVFDSGRMMVIQDPSGAIVSLWQAQNHIGSGLVNTPGAMTWNELSTRDPQAAIDFFGALLGWAFQDGPMPGYQMILNNGRMNGGIITMTEEWEGLPPHWMVYFSVAHLDEVAEKVKANGGTMNTPAIEAAGTGRFAVFADPAGAHFSLMQLEAPDTWAE